MIVGFFDVGFLTHRMRVSRDREHGFHRIVSNVRNSDDCASLMPTQRLSMRRIREVLRLRHQGLIERVIARMLGVSNGVVHGHVRRRIHHGG
jgi:DNA-binding NarL/FixJ family response regulator